MRIFGCDEGRRIAELARGLVALEDLNTARCLSPGWGQVEAEARDVREARAAKRRDVHRVKPRPLPSRQPPSCFSARVGPVPVDIRRLVSAERITTGPIPLVIEKPKSKHRGGELPQLLMAGRNFVSPSRANASEVARPGSICLRAQH